MWLRPRDAVSDRTLSSLKLRYGLPGPSLAMGKRINPLNLD